MNGEYVVSIETRLPRDFAAVRARLPLSEVPARFRAYLDPVYAAARNGGPRLDGQNIFVYRDVPGSDRIADVDFGVGLLAPFERIGDVHPAALPAGEVATTTHWGSYATLGNAHAAVMAWCREHGKALAGPRWEIYGHWDADPRKCRTEVSYLVAEER
ncbi:MAG: GyrI-like domain-containing protein [Thermoanaerobaculia bacterium]